MSFAEKVPGGVTRLTSLPDNPVVLLDAANIIRESTPRVVWKVMEYLIDTTQHQRLLVLFFGWHRMPPRFRHAFLRYMGKVLFHDWSDGGRPDCQVADEVASSLVPEVHPHRMAGLLRSLLATSGLGFSGTEYTQQVWNCLDLSTRSLLYSLTSPLFQETEKQRVAAVTALEDPHAETEGLKAKVASLQAANKELQHSNTDLSKNLLGAFDETDRMKDKVNDLTKTVGNLRTELKRLKSVWTEDAKSLAILSEEGNRVGQRLLYVKSYAGHLEACVDEVDRIVSLAPAIFRSGVEIREIQEELGKVSHIHPGKTELHS